MGQSRALADGRMASHEPGGRTHGQRRALVDGRMASHFANLCNSAAARKA